MTTRVLLVDDNALFRSGLRLHLDQAPGFEVVGETGDVTAAIESAHELRPDLVVIDVAMPGTDSVRAVQDILANLPEAGVVALSAQLERRLVGPVLQAGARGFLLKRTDPEDLVAALRTVAGGETFLSPSIASIVVSGMTGEESASPERDPTHLVLRTRLREPAPMPDQIPRSVLVEQWTSLRARPFTVVSASAGYGKSTLASQWLEASDGPHAWLSLDEEDNEPRVFLAALIASIGIPFPGACSKTRDLLGASEIPAASILSRILLNDLDELPESMVLVLDDYHRIRSEVVHEMMAEWLRNPPTRVHTILLTRRDPPLPVSLLRGRGLVNELGIGETRFSLAETSAFLGRVVSSPLGDAAIRRIHERLEGWPAGMRLLAQSLREAPDPEPILAGLEGGFATIVTYLLDEVMARLPERMSEAMMRISILDRFSAVLCEALHEPTLSREDCHAYLDHLERDNLFLVSLDSSRRWFRFHHLFQDLLQRQLKSRYAEEDITLLHARASRWFSAEGHFGEAIRHSLAAGDGDRATRIVEENRHDLLDTDRWYVLQNWLSAFPEREVRRHPELLLARLWVLLFSLDTMELEETLDLADTLIAEEDPLRPEVDFFRAWVYFATNDGSRSLQHVRSALARLPERRGEVWAQTELVHGLALQMEGEAEAAIERLNELLYGPLAVQGAPRTRIQATVVYIHLLAGRLPEAQTADRELRRHASRSDYRYAEAWALYLEGIIRFWSGDMDNAADVLSRTSEWMYIVEKRLVLDGLLGLAMANEHEDRPDLADEAMADSLEYARSLRDPSVVLAATSGRVRFSLLRGEESAAADFLRGQPPLGENLLFWIDSPETTRCRALLAEGSPESRLAALERLEELLRTCRSNHNVLQNISIHCLLSRAHGRGETKKAADHARQAANLAAPGGVWQPFLEAGPLMVELLRYALDQDPAAESLRLALAALGAAPEIDTGPLTAREAEVLRLVAEGLSNKEIAGRIYRSMETVKKHLYNTYQKLGVDSRIAALTKARELGILPRDRS